MNITPEKPSTPAETSARGYSHPVSWRGWVEFPSTVPPNIHPSLDAMEGQKFSMLEIALAVGAETGFVPSDLRCATRRRAHVRARWAAMYFSRYYGHATLPEIGRHFRRDHSTVIHALRQVHFLLDRENSPMVDLIAAVMKRLRGV